MADASLQNRIHENPNPQAVVGFVIFYPFQFHVFKNVYKYIADKAEFIVDMGPFYPVKQPEELKKNIVEILKKKKVFFRVLNYEDYRNEEHLEEFFSGYKCLVSLWLQGCVRLACNGDKKKVHLTYGAGKEIITYSFSKAAFDLILAYGENDSKFFSLYTQCKIVGNPKFDDWFNNTLDIELLENIQEKIDKDKKTLLYLPTHSDLSSIDQLASPLKNLSQKYNVVVKQHYFNNYEERIRKEKLKGKDIILLDDSFDLLPLFKIADVVISDNSSAIFDVILADKPIIVTDFLTNDYLDYGHKLPRSNRRGFANALTYSGSIEQRIKKDGTVITVKNLEKLQEAIDQALLDTIDYQEARKKLREKIFSFNDGRSGERAAQEIKNLLLKNNMPEKPLFYHLILAHEKNVMARGAIVERQDNFKRGIKLNVSKNAISKKTGKINHSKFISILTSPFAGIFLKIGHVISIWSIHK